MEARLTFFAKRFVTRVSVAPFRLLSYVLHATGLEHFYKPRFVRSAAQIGLTSEVLEKLPKYCYSLAGTQMDPMNLLVIGTDAQVKQVFKSAQWHRANPASPLHLLFGLLAVVLKRPYASGPFAPLYVNIALQDLAYQQTTRKNNFRQRHHLRLWRTGVVLRDKQRVWVGAASFDDSVKVQLRPPFVEHSIDPNIDEEREYVARSLKKQGALTDARVPMTPPILAMRPRHSGKTANKYYTDGQAVVVQL